jgi:hypothetical protein
VILFALILATGASNYLTLFDEIVRIPRGQWRAINVSLHQRPAQVQCRYQVVRGSSNVRAVLMSREDVTRFQQGQDYHVMSLTAADRKGELRHIISRPGDYIVLIENDSKGSPSYVQLHLGLEFNRYTSFEPLTVSPRRRSVIIAVSLLLFALIGAWSGWRLLRATRGRRTPPPPQLFV